MAQDISFDDLIPAKTQPQSPTATATPQDISFDDLIPQQPQSNVVDDSGNPSFEDLMPQQGPTASGEPLPAISGPYPTGAVMSGAHAGAIGLKGLLGDIIPMMVDKATGDVEGQKKQLAEYQQKQKEIQTSYPRPFPSYLEAVNKSNPEIADVANNIWTQAKYDLASGLVANVPAIAAIAITGGLAAPEVVGANAAISDATDTLLTTYAKRYAAKTAMTAGAGFAANEPQMVAASYIDRLQETGVDSPTTAVVAGTFANALQSIPFIQVAKGMIPKPLQKEVTNEVAKIVLQRLTLSELPKGILGSAVTGGVATAGGTLINQMATKIVNDAPYDLFSKENVDRLIDSGLSGSVTMAGIHTLTALPGAFFGSTRKTSPETDYTNSDVVKNSLPVVSEGLPSPEGSPQQPLPPRPSRKAHTGPDGVVNEDSYQEARTNYENYFQDRFKKSPEQYYKDRAAELPPEEPKEGAKVETPEESLKSVNEVLNDFVPNKGGPDEPPPPPAVASAILKDGSGTRDVVVDHTKHTLPVFLKMRLDKTSGNYPPTLEGVHQIGMDYLLTKQKETGHEHTILIDKSTGKIIETHTDNNSDRTNVGSQYGKSYAKDPSKQLSYMHNHPGDKMGNSSPLSPADLKALAFFRGIHDMGAVGANKEYSHASMTPLLHALKDISEETNTQHKQSVYAKVINRAHKLSRDVAKEFIKQHPEGYQGYIKIAPFADSEAMNRALSDLGLTQYSSNHYLEGDANALVNTIKEEVKVRLKDYIDKNHKATWREANERARQLRPTYDRLTKSGIPTGGIGKIHGVSEGPTTESPGRTGSPEGRTRDPSMEAGEQPPLKQPFDENTVQRNIANAEPHDNLKSRNFAIPKALDRITQEVTGNKEFNVFHNLSEDHTTIAPEQKANLFNMMRTGLDLVKGQAKRMFTSDPTALTEFFHHALDENSGLLTASDRVLLENSLSAIRKKVSEKLGIDPRDLLTNYPDADIQAQAFHDFMKTRYEGGTQEPLGSASPVFNKLGNLLYRQGQVLNANKLNGVDSFASKLNKEQLNDALYGIAEKRNQEWLGRRVGATVDEGRDIIANDPDFTDLANIKNPNDIKHLTRADNYLGTAMFMATKYPWMSDVIQHFNNKIDRVAQISKQIGTVPRQILSKNRNNFSMIHDILDAGRMNSTKAKIEGPEGARVLRFKWHDGSERIIQDQHLIDQFEAVRNNYKATLGEDEGDFRKYLSKTYGLPEMSTPEDITSHAERLQAQVDLAGKDDPVSHTVIPQIKELNEIASALGNMRKMKNIDYVPHLRFGKLAVMAFKKASEDGGKDELVFLDGLEENDKGKINKIQEQELNQKIAKFRNNPDYYILGDQPNNRMRLTQNDVLKKIPPQHVSMELIYSLFGDQTKETADAMQELIQGKINKSKLAFYLKPSSNIEGYSKDWPRALETWAHARSLNQSNKESDAHLSKVLDYVGNLEKNGAYQPHDIKWLKDFVEYNRDRSSDLMLLRNLNFLQAMGGRMKTAIMQLFNGPQLMVPLLTNGGGNMLRLQASWANNLRKGAQIISKAWGHTGRPLNIDEVWQEVARKGILTPDQLQMAKTFAKSHLLDQTILDDNAGTSYESRDVSGKFKKQREITSQLLGQHIGEAEKMSRMASILTAAQELSDPESFRRLQNAYEGDPGWKAFRDSVTSRQKGAYTEKEALAMYMMEQAHGRYGKSGRGRVQRGMSAAVFFPFSTQMLIQWELMKNQASTKGVTGKLAAMYILGSFLALGGLSSMPGYATVRAGYNIYDALQSQLRDAPTPAKDFDIDLRRWLGNAVGEDWANNIQKGPIRNLTGLDISGTTTMPTSFETIAAKPLDVLTGILQGKSPDLTQMVGPALSPVNTAAQAIKAKSLTPLMPPVMRDIQEAARGMDPNNPQGGIKTLNGVQIQPSKNPQTGEANYSAPERIARGLGFTPTQESQQKEAYHGEKFVDESNKSRAGDIVQKATESQINMLAAIKAGNDSLAQAYRNQVNDLRKSWISFQKQAKTPNINVDSFNTAIVKGAMEAQKGWEPKTLKGRLQAEEVKNRSIYGYKTKEEKQTEDNMSFDDLIPKGK